eukprot:ctg_254.g105
MPEREDQHAERAEPQPPGDATHESTASAPALPPPARVSPSASAASSEGPPSNIHSVTPRSAEAHTDESTSSAEKAGARAFWAAQHRFDALLEQYRQEHSSSPVDDPPSCHRPKTRVDARDRGIFMLRDGALGQLGNSAAASATEAPRTAPANAEAVETVAPEAGHSTIWLLPFEHITSVRKSSYWYVDNAVDVSATAVLCSSLNGPRTEPTRSAAGSADETAMVTVRFAAFSGVDRDAAYRILMKQWMARLSLMALEGRLPESIKASHRDKPDMSSAEAAAETSPSHRESRAAPDASSGSPVTTVTTETNHHETPNANSPEHPVAYDMDAGECELEIPLTGRDAASDLGSLAFQLLLADASSLPRQMHARMAHTDVCLPAWQALSTAKASEPKDKNATALTPATGWHRVISYQATVRRGPLTFTGHCIEVHRFYRSAADSNAECWRHEVLITTRELPACDAFRVHQQMQWQLRRDPNRRIAAGGRRPGARSAARGRRLHRGGGASTARPGHSAVGVAGGVDCRDRFPVRILVGATAICRPTMKRPARSRRRRRPVHALNFSPAPTAATVPRAFRRRARPDSRRGSAPGRDTGRGRARRGCVAATARAGRRRRVNRPAPPPTPVDRRRPPTACPPCCAAYAARRRPGGSAGAARRARRIRSPPVRWTDGCNAPCPAERRYAAAPAPPPDAQRHQSRADLAMRASTRTTRRNGAAASARGGRSGRAAGPTPRPAKCDRCTVCWWQSGWRTTAAAAALVAVATGRLVVSSTTWAAAPVATRAPAPRPGAGDSARTLVQLRSSHRPTGRSAMAARRSGLPGHARAPRHRCGWRR